MLSLFREKRGGFTLARRLLVWKGINNRTIDSSVRNLEL